MKTKHRLVDIASCLAFVVVATHIAFDAIAGLERVPSLALLFPAVALAGYVAADFASGFVHWLADTYGSPQTPIVGAKLVAPFREHHDDPSAIARHDFLEANGDNCLITQLVLMPTLLLVPGGERAWGTVVSLFVLVLATSVVLTSMVHGWAHREDPPRVVRWLQARQLVLSPEHHAVHHAAPHATHYCITTGWLNPLLDRLQFFRHLERLFAWFGIQPTNERAVVDREAF